MTRLFSMLSRVTLALAISLVAASAAAKPGTSPSLAVIAGDNQSVVPDRTGRSAFAPIKVQVTGAGTLPANARVHFAIATPALNMNCLISGGHTPTEADVPIDSQGVATLDQLRNHKSISCKGGAGTIIVTATLGPASTKATVKAAHNYVLSLNQPSPVWLCSGNPRTCPQLQFVFKLLDAGFPVKGAAITFTDNNGGITSSSSPLTTDANGTAVLSYSISKLYPQSLGGTATSMGLQPLGYGVICTNIASAMIAKRKKHF